MSISYKDLAQYCNQEGLNICSQRGDPDAVIIQSTSGCRWAVEGEKYCSASAFFYGIPDGFEVTMLGFTIGDISIHDDDKPVNGIAFVYWGVWDHRGKQGSR